MMFKRFLSLVIVMPLLFSPASSYAQKSKAVGKIVKGAVGVAAGYELLKNADNKKKVSGSDLNTTTTATTTTTVLCSTCGGTGGGFIQTMYGGQWFTCTTCNGKGTITKTIPTTQKRGSSISFTGYGACSYTHSLTKEVCKCTGYKGDGAKGPCRTCKHGYTTHYR